MYCTNCGLQLEEKWIHCPNCGTKRATLNQEKKETTTFPEFITKFAKERNITEKETKKLALKVLTK